MKVASGLSRRLATPSSTPPDNSPASTSHTEPSSDAGTSQPEERSDTHHSGSEPEQEWGERQCAVAQEPDRDSPEPSRERGPAGSEEEDEELGHSARR